jgi:hypothetical protein
MAAQDNLSPAQFFHATDRVLEPGEKLISDNPRGVFMAGGIDAARGWADTIGKYHIHEVTPNGPVKAFNNPGGREYTAKGGATVVRHVESLDPL